MRRGDKRVLITCGPTWVPIDDMRIIGNQSTGKLGQMMARDWVKAGASVTLLEGPVVMPFVSRSVTILKFCFYKDFLKLFKTELKKPYDIVIHAAAVSDYQLSKPFKTKLQSQVKHLCLDLVPTKKIIHLIKRINPNIFLVGFKLESRMTKKLAYEKSRELFKYAKCDLVIANKSSEKGYSGYILNNSGEILAKAKTRSEISSALIKAVLA